MSTRVLIAAAAVATVAFGLRPGTALANKPVYMLSGTVTTVPIGSTITVNGHTYRIARGSPAVTQVQDIIRGETVKVTLSGPAGATSTKVVAIHASASH